MKFNVLGPLSVIDDCGESITIGRAKTRILLALLLTHVNRTVSREELIGALWADLRIQSARANLKTYIWNLRRALSPADPSQSPVKTVSSGYSVHLTADSVDMLVFERLVSEAREARRRGDNEIALAKLDTAVGLWRGMPFEDIPLTTDALVATTQSLQEHRLLAREELIGLRIELGDDAQVIGELQGLVVEHPMRERLWQHLMTALYRAGRQADALDAYQRLRRCLLEELGADPSRPLQDLQHQILNADPRIDRLTDERVQLADADAATT